MVFHKDFKNLNKDNQKRLILKEPAAFFRQKILCRKVSEKEALATRVAAWGFEKVDSDSKYKLIIYEWQGMGF